MGWNRVIQDSDEEEPLIEDDFPASPDPLQDPGFSSVQHHDHPVHQDAHTTEHTFADGFPGPQLNVNFDQFLQSQGTHAASTSSQQQREERWIPSTTEGGGGSINAMMTEIGFAQQRLFDDPSSAGQHLPSTATHYPSEISQPGSFPAIQPDQFHQTNPVTHGQFIYNQVSQNAPYEATQLLAPGVAPAYDYSTPATLVHADSPSDGLTASTSIQTVPNVLGVPTDKKLQRANALQSMMGSPHDTEPMSSVVSPGLNKARDNTMLGLMSPHRSPESTYDELATPAVYVQVPSAVKRTRPLNEFLPEDDDDDELAMDGGPEPSPSKQARKAMPEPPIQSAATDKASESVSENAIASENDALEVSGTNNLDELSSTDKIDKLPTSGKSSTKEYKKKKDKKIKKAPAISNSRVSDDDDVIWVDSRPLGVRERQGQNISGTESSTGSSSNIGTPQPDPIASSKESSTTGKPAPKKRGRKRKIVAEEATETSSEQALEQKPPPLSKVLVFNANPVEGSSGPNSSHLGTPQPDATVSTEESSTTEAAQVQPVEKNLPPVSEVLKPNANPAEVPSDPKAGGKADEAENADPLPQEDTHVPQEDDQIKAPPQIPHKPDQTPSTPMAGSSTTARKGPAKHSPISSTSKVPYRVGLSKRARIAPLLKIVRK
ncbi:hypothetical protein N7454_000207 [Penicillium verhagenii]|nr:hypothetical protein N7454_000207 [Penicillium verhagenii]